MKKKRRDYTTIRKDCYNGHPENERIRINSKVVFDRSVFQKDLNEKKTLKWLKQQAKNK